MKWGRAVIIGLASATTGRNKALETDHIQVGRKAAIQKVKIGSANLSINPS